MAEDPNTPLLRRPVIFVPPVVPETWSQSFAHAVGEINGTPDLVTTFKNKFETTGNLPEFKAFEDNFYRAKDEQAAMKVVVRLRERAKELGLDDPTLIQLDINDKLAAIQAEGEALRIATKNALPEGYQKAITDPTQYAESDRVDQQQLTMLGILNQQAEQFATRTNASQKKVEAEYQAWIDAERPEPKSLPGKIGEFFSQIGVTLLPGNAMGEANAIAKAFGVDYDSTGTLNPSSKLNLNVGDIRLNLRKMYLNAKPEERERLWGIFKQASGHILSDLDARSLAEYIFNPKAGAPPDEEVDYMLNMVMPWVDTIGALAGTYSLGKYGLQKIPSTANAALRATINANKQATANIVARAIVEATSTADPILKTQAYTKWGLSEAQVGISQVPKELTNLEVVADFPDNLVDEVQRVRKIQDDLSSVLVRSENVDIGDESVTAVVDREAQHIEETFGGTLRPGMSTIKLKSDRSGIEFGVVVGKDANTGFLTNEDAFVQAEHYINEGQRVSILQSDGTSTVPVLTGREALEELDAIRAGATPQSGTYFVKVYKDYTYRPTDRMLFGDDPVVAPTWLGRAANYLLHPDNRFSQEFYSGYLKNYLNEQSMKAYMGRIVAPIRAMSNQTQRRINDMYEWSYDFARQFKAEPTVEDLINKFDYAATSEEIRGFYIMKQYFKTAHEIQNRRLYRDWTGRGFKTVRSKSAAGGTYHGVPIPKENLPKSSMVVYDPEIQGLRTLDNTTLQDVYAKGGTIIRSDMAMRGVKNRHQFSYNILVNGGDKAAYEVVPLIQNPLRYIPGYWPRMYKDNYYIRRQVKNAIVDGRGDPNFSQVVAVAGTKKEAEAFVAYANKRSKKGPVYSIQEDKRLSLNDSTANDLEFLRTEGRLFFDSRKPHLRDVHGVRAEIYDPINMLSRSTAAISRQIATESLTKGLKNAWYARYGNLIRGNVETSKTSAIALELEQKLTTTGGKEINDALLSWQYIQVMEGSVNSGNQFFRRAAIASAEWLGSTLKGKLGATHPGNWVIRNGGNLSPVEGLKNFAFHYFITMRPLRQILVQSSQHLFISALDTTYGLGRLQKDTTMLLLGIRRKARAQVFSTKEETFFSKVNARLMGLNSAEYAKLSTEFDKAGLLQTIDVHSIAGTSMSSVEDLPLSVAGDVAKKTGELLTAKPLRNLFRKVGFEAGESANLAATYLMALRLYRNANPGIKSLMQITDEAWQEISSKASGLALTMHRAGASNYQYNVMSLPLQFLQYSHKTMLVGAKAVLGDKLASNITTTQARRIMAGQVLLFGGAGFGVKDYVSSWLGAVGFGELQGTEVEDIIAGGTLDWTLDKTLQTVSEDPELDLTFDTLLAPGGSVASTGRQFWEAAMEQPIYQALAGPATEAGSQVMQFVKLAQMMRGDGISEEDSLKEALLTGTTGVATGVAVGLGGAWVSDLWKARLAQKTGYWITNNGATSGIEAQWGAIVAKGLLGLNSQTVIDNYNLLENERDYKDELDKIAEEYSAQVNSLSIAFHDSPGTADDYLMRLRRVSAAIKGGLEPEEWQYVLTKFYQSQQNLAAQRRSALDIIGEDITRGLPPEESMIARLRSSQLLKNNPRKEDLIRLLEGQIKSANEQATNPIDIFGRDAQNIEQIDKAIGEN